MLSGCCASCPTTHAVKLSSKNRFYGVKGIIMLCHGGPKNVWGGDLKHINKSKPPKRILLQSGRYVKGTRTRTVRQLVDQASGKRSTTDTLADGRLSLAFVEERLKVGSFQKQIDSTPRQQKVIDDRFPETAK